MDTPKSGLENREAFRIDDTAELSYQLVSEEEVNNPIYEYAEQGQTNDPLLHKLEELDNKSKPLLNRISQQNVLLGEYFQLLEQKMNLLIRNLSEVPSSAVSTQQKINLSESGIAFGTSEQLPKDKVLKLKLTLLPSYYTLIAYCNIIVSKTTDSAEGADKDYPFWTATQFKAIQPADQKQIAFHMLQLQTQKV